MDHPKTPLRWTCLGPYMREANGRAFHFERYTWPGSNWRPSACETDVIATRPQVQCFLTFFHKRTPRSGKTAWARSRMNACWARQSDLAFQSRGFWDRHFFCSEGAFTLTRGAQKKNGAAGSTQCSFIVPRCVATPKKSSGMREHRSSQEQPLEARHPQSMRVLRQEAPL